MTSFISGTGLHHPETAVTNEQLVDALNAYADRFNSQNASAIEAGETKAIPTSDADFIYKASGIRQRYVLDPVGILDIDRMQPKLAAPEKGELCYMAQFGKAAGQKAMDAAGVDASEIDLVICGASNFERPYPAVAVEVQNALGINQGFAFDLNVACSSATFAMQNAKAMVEQGIARNVLVVVPELATPQLDYTSRDSHFIFGDVCTAFVVTGAPKTAASNVWKINSTQAATTFSTNVWSMGGFMNHVYDPKPREGSYFEQNGRLVMKEVCPLVSKMIKAHLADAGASADDISRFWLHQANQHMNDFVCKSLMGAGFDRDRAPLVLNEFGNSAAAGSVIAFHRHSSDLPVGAKGLICSFGAGYSAGLAVLERAA